MMKNWIIAALAVALALSIAGVVVAQTQRTATVEVRIFENVRDPSVHYVASRPRGGPWTATERLSPLYDGFVQGGRYRFRDVFVNATVPQPLPSGIELVDLACEDHQHPDGTYRILRGSLRNSTNATLTAIVITAALANEEGVEVLQVTDEIAGEISRGGERSFTISFLRAPRVEGACSIVSVDYSAAIRYEVPIP